MSNAKVKLVTDAFKDYNCENIIARRAINSKKPGSKTTEVIIYTQYKYKLITIFICQSQNI